ncbi:putative calcium channel protein [Trypanosoma theileri]|uniref:Putative calcium channel protein n=1 Tax=Trypanosoma theileri TaxID=67003 RepID=A0A1X0P8V8_9TRYP|nr:putative calcium channel protein [Trypanosoma theileri]ORC93271.1 putative calcium channel protein [Trypanosoma theileri]
MAGVPPPPYPLEPTIAGTPAAPAAPTGRLRLPPPLPPVRGAPTAPTPGLLPTPNRPPMGRLAPLQRSSDTSDGQDAPKRSPSPRMAANGMTPQSVDQGSVLASANENASVFESNGDGPTPARQRQQQQQQGVKKSVERLGTPSGKTRKLITPVVGSHRDAEFRDPDLDDQNVEQLCPLQVQTRPVERFFVEYKPKEGDNDKRNNIEMDENDILFDRLAEYTDDDSFFSSGSSVLEQDPRRLQKDPLRGPAVRSVYDTLNLRSLTSGRMPQVIEDEEIDNAGWMYQVHQRAIALHHSSFFIFPPCMTARVVVYNVMHHWLTELLLIFIILGYSIFTASWARYQDPELEKPDFMIFADVFYTVIYGIELVMRLFASGFILHQRAFFRSPWHWLDTAVFVLMVMNCTGWKYLWNFTAFRLIRVIKACTYIPMPVRMKLLAKSLLRSTNKLIQVSLILIYALFFFALIGLQLFRGALHHRCVNSVTGGITNQICHPGTGESHWFYWGHVCQAGYTCVEDVAPNPHYDFQNFDNVGHALLSTFQIMTFQGWTGLLQETNDAVTVLVILYYAFTILFCAWFIPSLYVGVFIEKIEKTSRLFIQKQLQLFDSMLQEQRQRLNAGIKLRDFVERDENGNLRHNPLDINRNDKTNSLQRINSDRGNSDSGEKGSMRSVSTDRDTPSSSNYGSSVMKRTKWTDEQRVQLHLSLTRQRELAEQSERKRRAIFKVNKNFSNSSNPLGGNKVTSQHVTVTGAGGGDFELGGRVGTVQHHPLTYTIGAAHGTSAPLAVRLENEQERLRFLKYYQDLAEGEIANITNTDGYNTRPNLIENGNVNGSVSRPPLGNSARHGISHAEEVPGGILATRESAGVIPTRRSAQRPISAGAGSTAARESNTPSAMHNSVVVAPQQEVLINDPEGGDFRYARTFAQRWLIIRNILHMFTEGYPLILAQYLWEHKRMQRRFGLTPLNYVNKYEEAALRKLRQRRTRKSRNIRRSEESDEFDDDNFSETEAIPNTKKDDTEPSDLSPIRMAKNIVENAPITLFTGIMLFFVFANGVFNASRHYGQPDYWYDGLFYAGVCFNALFFLELVIRFIAVGPGPFIWDFFNVLSLIVIIIGFFELGFGRSNTITLLNWVRFLRVFRVAPFTPMRRVSRVLLLGFQDIVYALVFFSVYMFMWILIGMSFFGGRIDKLDRTNDDYSTRGNFDTFSQATFAVSQGFSYVRDEWLYMSWDGMRARGGYTIMYFLAVVGVAFIFRYLFISVFTWAWQCEEERDDYVQLTTGRGRRGGPQLRWFDFTVWRSFKHIHGGFERRDVAPDEVFHLNQDMRRQLRIAEAKERFSRRAILSRGPSVDQRQLSVSSVNATPALNNYKMSTGPPQPSVVLVPRFVNVGGQIQRQMSMPIEFDESERPPINAPISQFQAENAQLRFARRYSAVPANVNIQASYDDRTGSQTPPRMQSPSYMASHEDTVSAVDTDAQLDDFQQFGTAGRYSSSARARGSSSNTQLQRRPSVTGHFTTLGYERPSIKKEGGTKENGHKPGEKVEEEHYESDITGGEMVYEHILLPGPRLRYKHVMVGRQRRVFERCLDCNTHKQMPLRAPPNVLQRTADELHAEHCHMAAVRSSRQLVLNAILGYVRLQKELGGPPTRETVETVLGQAWSCGMLLFETIEYLSCADIELREFRTWDRTLEALQLQQWLIGLHVGEEQVGRATLAYILAHKETQERAVSNKYFQRSWRNRSFFVLSPSNPFRQFVTKVVQSAWFEWFILAVIFAASICLCFYNPQLTNFLGGKYTALHVLDDIFAIIFAVEMVLKWISMGVVLDLHVAYFWHRWNIFDCFITIVSLLAIAPAYDHFRYLKVMRCFRILGPLRHCTFNKELSKLAVTMWDCIPTLANVLLLCLLNYIVWCIIAVRLFMDQTHSCSNETIINGTLCVEEGGSWDAPQRNFDNFYESLLTMFEVSTGSKWLDVIYTGVDAWSENFAPIANRHPAKGLFFIAYYYVSNLVLFSLFVASMIYCYLLTKNAAEGAMGITFEHQLWIRMQRMILRLKPRVQLVPLGNIISRFLHRVVTHVVFEVVMACILFFNLITMSLYWYGNSSKQEDALDALQYVWVAFFTVELILRLAAHGIRAFSRWSFCFDLFVTCLSYVQIGVNTTDNHKVPFNVNVLRLLNLGRLLKLVDVFVPVKNNLRLLYQVLILSASALVNVTLILLLAVFVFTILGMHFIGRVHPVVNGYIDDTYNNFMTFPNALIMTFRLTTLENWVSMLRSSVADGTICELDDCRTSNWAPVYYVPIVICFALMIVTLYIAVVVDHYVTVVRMHASVSRIQDLRRFRALWSARDPNAKLVLRTRQLPELLEALRPPLGLSSRHNRVELLRLLREYDIPDHGGRVHYDEVLVPLARRVLAMAFSEDEVDDGATFEALWRLSESSLRALPTVLGNRSDATTAQYFAVSYVQAAYRRRKACRQMQQARADLWRKGRNVCDELGLPYKDYGFGKTSLFVDEKQKSKSASPSTGYKDDVDKEDSTPAPRASSPMTPSENNSSTPPAARLPGVYQPAIDEKERRFGPDVPNAVRRHETRSEKLRRKEEERQQQQQMQQPQGDNTPTAHSAPRSSSLRLHSTEYQPPLGTDPSSWLNSEMSRHMSGSGSPANTSSNAANVLPNPQGTPPPE